MWCVCPRETDFNSWFTFCEQSASSHTAVILFSLSHVHTQVIAIGRHIHIYIFIAISISSCICKHKVHNITILYSNSFAQMEETMTVFKMSRLVSVMGHSTPNGTIKGKFPARPSQIWLKKCKVVHTLLNMNSPKY